MLHVAWVAWNVASGSCPLFSLIEVYSVRVWGQVILDFVTLLS
jgi:hypothetical protein